MRGPQTQRASIAGGTVAAIVLMASMWFLLISPMQADTRSLNSQRSAADLGYSQLSSKVNALKLQKQNIAALRTQLKSLVTGLPGDSGVADFTRQVSAQAAASGVTIASISIGTITAYIGAPVAASSATGTATTAGTAGTTTAAGGLQSVPVTITSDGPAAMQFAFLKQLQQVGPRRALITSTQFAPGTTSVVASIDPSSTMTTMLTVFSAPTTPAEQSILDKLIDGSGAK